MSRFTFSTQVCLLGAVLAFGSVLANASGKSFIAPLNVTPGSSTVPANGDVNPYGVAVVPRSTGKLVRDHVLISNFNNAASAGNPGGLQGRGTTIVDVAPDGEV